MRFELSMTFQEFLFISFRWRLKFLLEIIGALESELGRDGLQSDKIVEASHS